MYEHLLRQLPSIQLLLERPEVAEAIAAWGREAVVRGLRETLSLAREAILSGGSCDLDPATLLSQAIGPLQHRKLRLYPVINATGILLHTGLGRAPLAGEAAEAVSQVVRGYCNLEFDLETGSRGERTSGIADLIRELTGAEAATVVNNNAAATILALRALAQGREVLVSRGQLVEIGGSFRLPEIFEVSGARLREVGTTNKTRLADYEKAIGPESAALLRVHPSNYRVVGFTESVSIRDLARLGRSRGIATIDDIGSGAIDARRPPAASCEPTVAEGLAAGADLVLFSGDKLLGGPQCGILVGTAQAIAKVSSDPLMRAIRVDKMTLAALEATLILARDYRHKSIPLWNFLHTNVDELMERAERIASWTLSEAKLNVCAVATSAQLGGGSMPAELIPSAAVQLGPPWPSGCENEDDVARRLRTGDPAVVPRIQNGKVLLDLRAITPSEDGFVCRAIANLSTNMDIKNSQGFGTPIADR